ncbi:MAG TPA: universal stress protein [Chloroflexota bacterium]|nr:universal stress protein [Chloroflexota bacterium]
MFQRIMVPLDGSELAERALPLAGQMAKAMGATIYLVRAVEAPAMWLAAPAAVYVPPTVYDDLLKNETEEAVSYLNRVREQLESSGLHVRADQCEGNPAVALLDYESAVNADLVVMCSHGRSGLSRFALGSVADRLVRHGTVPVLLVRPFGEPASLEHAVVPLDGSTRSEEVLKVVDHLARYVVREVTLLRVIAAPKDGPEAERYLQEAAQHLTQEHLACWRRVEQGDPADVILSTADHQRLVIMATHGRSGLTRWALGSVADRVVRGGAAAVLLVREGAAA